MATDTDETRAEIARRRLAQLAASFEARLPPEDGRPEQPEPEGSAPRLAPTHLRVVGVLGVAAVVLLGWWLLAGRPTTEPADDSLAFAPASSPSPEAAATELVVDVAGKVKNPGIVTLPPGSRVYEAIEAAGGLKGDVDTSGLNLARVLADGEQVLVGVEPVAGAAPAGAPGSSAKVDLNTATAEQLDALPGVGPVTAAAILQWRADHGRFSSVDDLLDVDGIGQATLARLRDLVRV